MGLTNRHVDYYYMIVLNVAQFFYTRFLDAYRCNPQKAQPMSCSLLLYIHLSMNQGCRYFQLSVNDNRHPKVQLELIKEHFYWIFSLDGILQGMRMHILLNLPTTTNKQSCPLFVLGKPLIKSIDLFSMVQQVQLRDDITLDFCEQACWYNKECIL